MPIIYESFTFPTTRRKYPTYKRELYAMVRVTGPNRGHYLDCPVSTGQKLPTEATSQRRSKIDLINGPARLYLTFQSLSTALPPPDARQDQEMPGRSFLENPPLKENPGIGASISVEGSLGTMIWLLLHSLTQPRQPCPSAPAPTGTEAAATRQPFAIDFGTTNSDYY